MEFWQNEFPKSNLTNSWGRLSPQHLSEYRQWARNSIADTLTTVLKFLCQVSWKIRKKCTKIQYQKNRAIQWSLLSVSNSPDAFLWLGDRGCARHGGPGWRQSPLVQWEGWWWHLPSKGIFQRRLYRKRAKHSYPLIYEGSQGAVDLRLHYICFLKFLHLKLDYWSIRKFAMEWVLKYLKQVSMDGWMDTQNVA